MFFELFAPRILRDSERFSKGLSGDFEDSDEIPEILTRFYKILEIFMRFQP